MTRARIADSLRRELAAVGVPGLYHDKIVTAIIGPGPRPVHLITANLTLACGHDGHDPSSSVAADVTCETCRKAGAR